MVRSVQHIPPWDQVTEASGWSWELVTALTSLINSMFQRVIGVARSDYVKGRDGSSQSSRGL